MKHAWIHKHRDTYPIAVMCHILRVSKSRYYESVGRPPSARSMCRERIREAVRQVHSESHGVYGSQKIAKVLAGCG